MPARLLNLASAIPSGRGIAAMLTIVPTVNEVARQIGVYKEDDDVVDYGEMALIAAFAVSKLLPLLGINDETVAKYLQIVKAGWEAIDEKTDKVQAHLAEVNDELGGLYQEYGVE